MDRKLSLRVCLALAAIPAFASAAPPASLSGIHDSGLDVKRLISQAARTYVAAKQCRMPTANRIRSNLDSRLSRVLTAQSLVDALGMFDDEVDALVIGRSPGDWGSCSRKRLNEDLDALTGIYRADRI